MPKSCRSTNKPILPLKVIDKPILIDDTEKDIELKPGCRFDKDIKMIGYSGTIICPRQVFFYGRLIFNDCECHIICEEDPNIFNQVILQDSVITLEGVSEGYADQLSETVLKLYQSKIYT